MLKLGKYVTNVSEGWSCRRLLLTFLAGVSIFAPHHLAAAQGKYPAKPIMLVVPFPPGGGTDIVHRAAANIAAQFLGQSIVILNKPGAAGVIGAKQVEGAEPDGYTLGGIASTALLTQYTAPNANSWARMAPIATLTYDAGAVAVRADSKWASLGEMVKFAKDNPGKVTMGNGGAGALQHMFAIALEQKAGVEFLHVPYPGGGNVVTALLGGQVDAFSLDVATILPHLKSGRIRLLAIAATQRYENLPNDRLFREEGVDLDIGMWRLVVAPKGTPPPEVIKRLQDAYLKAIRTPEFAASLGGSQIAGMGAVETARTMDDYAKVMKRLADELELRSKR